MFKQQPRIVAARRRIDLFLQHRMPNRNIRPRLQRLEDRAVPATYTVTTTADSGDGSLRQMIVLSNNTAISPGADTIVFDSGLFNVPRTIKLDTGQLTISGSLTIQGPSSLDPFVTIDGKDLGRIFNISAVAQITVNLLNLEVTNGAVTGAEQGGGIYIADEIVTLTNCDVTSNLAADSGGGIHLESAGASLTLNNSSVNENVSTAGSGGGIHLESDGAKLTLINSEVRNNVSTTDMGGGISTDGAATIVIQNSSISSNEAQGRGGGIATSGNCNLTLQDANIDANESLGSFGGGMSLSSSSIVNISDSDIYSNHATSSGGGIAFSGGTLTITNSSITQNSATTEGGGLSTSSAATITIRNSTFSNNSTGNGGGVAFGIKSSGSFTLQNSTFYKNSATGVGGGIFRNKLSTATIAITSSIVSGNIGSAAGDDISSIGSAVSLNFCAIGESTGFSWTGANNLPFGSDLKLPSYGSSTVQPAVGSPLRNAGSNPAGLTTDQRGSGYPRQRGAGVDIGAVEVHELVVLNSNDSGLGSLRQAILDANAAAEYDTINFDPTAFSSKQTITLTTGQLVLTEESRIIGPAIGVTIDGNNASLVLGVVGDFVASDLTIVNGNGSAGGGLAIQNGDASLTRVNIFDCSATFGAGLYFKSPPTIVPFGIIEHQLSLTDCTLSGNTAAAFGGGLYARYADPLLATNCNVTSNTAAHGGGVYIRDGGLSSFSGVINQNVAGANGGGLYATISGPLFVSNTTIVDNSAGTNGGGVYSASSQALNLTNVNLSDNTVSDGTAVNNGGGLYISAGNVSLTKCNVANNSTVDRGGGIYANSATTITMTNCTIADNSANTGGGLSFANDGNLTVTGSTLSGNSAKATGGGGCYFFGSGTLAFRNSTLSGNSAATIGGAIAAYFTGSLTVQNSTVTANSAVNAGGGIARGSGTGTINVTSSIVAGNLNAVAPDISSTITVNVNYSAIGSSAGFAVNGANNRAFGSDLKLGPLADNGGLTKTHALGAGSDAINNGSNTLALTTDQRGSVFVRANPTGVPDIGAYEFQPGAKIVSLKVNDNSPQRSRVTSLTVTFDSPVTLPANKADAFQLSRQSDNALVDLNASMAGNDVTLTFTGGPLDFDSLGDGRYTLTAFAALINGGLFDGNGDGGAGENYLLIGDTTNKLYRLFGDEDGDGVVTSDDFAEFRKTFGTGINLAFDFNNNGTIDSDDFAEFRKRFGISFLP